MDDDRNERHENDDDAIGEWKVFEVHPPGSFEAEFVGFEVASHEKYGKTVWLRFKTEEEKENGEPFIVSCPTSPTLGSKGRVYKMLTAMGVETGKINPAKFKLSDYIGQKLQLAITNETNEQKQTVDRIESFLPLQRKKKRQVEEEETPKRKPADDDDEDEDEATARAARRKKFQNDED